MDLRRLGARRYWVIWVAAAPLAIWALVRVFGLDGGTAIAFLLAFTPQALLGGLFVAAIAVALRNWAAALVAGVATLVLAVEVVPRTVGEAEAAPPGSERLDVLSANVHFGTADPARLVELARENEVELLAVQELTPGFDRHLRAAGIGWQLPHSIVSLEPPELGGGRGLYSSLPLHRIPGETINSVRLALGAGTAIRVFNVHPRTPRPGGSGKWAASLGRLPSGGDGAPRLLLGDFNATLDHSVLRDVLDRGYRDAGATTGEGLVATWPAGKFIPPQVTIDHVLADRRFGIAGYGVEELAGSDHRAVHASLFLPTR